MSELWMKSSYSNSTGDCVEVAIADLVAVRDSKDPAGPRLTFGRADWAAFTERVRHGAA